MGSDSDQRRATERAYERMSPFELKNKLIGLAEAGEQNSIRVMLDAGSRRLPTTMRTSPE